MGSWRRTSCNVSVAGKTVRKKKEKEKEMSAETKIVPFDRDYESKRNVASSEEVSRLRAMVKQTTDQILAQIKSADGTFMVDEAKEAGEELNEALEKLPARRTDGTAAEILESEKQFALARENAYRNYTLAMTKVQANLHAIAVRESAKIDACSAKNAELAEAMKKLKESHKEQMDALRKQKTELMTVPTQPPLKPPTKEHVMQLFGYMVLKISVL